MANQYLLPCLCGRQTVIEPRQAGQTISCECGASLLTPTLLDIRTLEPVVAEVATRPPRPMWGIRQGLRLVGVVLLLVGIGGGLRLFLNPPISRFDVIDPVKIQESYQSLSPTHTWDVWNIWKQGLDRRVDQQYAAALDQHHLWWIAAAFVTLAGVALIVAGTLGNRRSRAVHQRPV